VVDLASEGYGVRMIHLWYSNYLERLVDALTEQAFGDACDPLEPRMVVVPNRNLETYLKLEVSRQRGIIANVEFLFLNTFLKRLLPSDVHLLDREMVRGLLLDQILEPEGAPVDEVESYLSVAADPQDRDRRAFQLADQLARFFEEYELSRPQMVGMWPHGTFLTEEPFAGTERWQRELWLRVFGPEGSVARMGSEVPVLRIGQFLDSAVTLSHKLNREVHFFGLSYLARQYYQVIERLAQNTDVHIYALNPCMEYWEDLPSEWRLRRAKQFQKRAQVQPALGLRDEADTLFGEEEDPEPLRLWGQPGRDHVRFLNTLTDSDFMPLFQDPLEDGDTLLHRIQHDIYARQPTHETKPAPYDDSLVVLECPTIQREVEIIASEIWRVMRDFSETGNELNFNDIAVIINPAHRDAYQSHIRAVFRDTWSIPHNVIDITASSNRRFLEGVKLLLELPFGDFKRDQLLRLLTHPNVLADSPDVRPEEWIRWVDELNILYGADASDMEGTYIKREVFHWDQGIKRLVLGAFMESDLDSPRLFGKGTEYIPHSTSPSELGSVTKLVRLTRKLITRARELTSQRQPLRDWYREVADWIRETLKGLDEDDEMDATRVLRAIDGLQERELSTSAVSYRVALDSVNATLANLEVTRGQYLAEGVVVSSFIPMRPIPFKVVFITGMGEREFPRMDVRSPLDLRWARSEQFDNFSSRRNDEYMFLETLISTRDRLYLSYVARNSHTGEEMMPSSVLREIDFMLRRYYLCKEDFERVHRKHPLRRFDPRYFSGDPDLLNVHPEALREAKTLALRASGIDPTSPELFDLLGEIELPDSQVFDDDVTISIRQIRRFLENPLQGTSEFFLGLSAFDEEDVFGVETENFVPPDSFTRRTLKDLFVGSWKRFGGVLTFENLEEHFQEFMRIEELRGDVPTGIFLDSSRRRHLRTMNTWLHNFQQLEIDLGEDPVVFNFGRDRERHAAVQFAESPTFEIENAHGKVKISISGKTAPMLVKSRVSVALGLGSDLGRWNNEYLFVPGFLDYAVLLATGHIEPGDWRVFVNGSSFADKRNLRTFERLEKDEAYEWLLGLFDAMLSGVHAYQFPADAALDHAFRDPKWPKPFDRIARGTRLKWGPIQNPTDEQAYRVPSGDELERLVSHRFGPYLNARARQ